MSENIILDHIPFLVSLSELSLRLHIRKGSAQEADLQNLLRQAEVIARPKAMFRIAFIEETRLDQVIIDGVVFTSRVLRTNLSQHHRSFPFIATCGRELDAWAHSYSDILMRFYADTIQESALRGAINHLKAHILSLYLPEISTQPGGLQLSEMNPGSLEDWPIDEQKVLFTLLGNVDGTIGVSLTKSMLMKPIKSVSGIYFTSQESYANCQLCPRGSCTNRTMAYDPTLYERKYGGGGILT
jgi:hypothetical protein